MDQKPQDKKQLLWSWKQFAVALGLIALGVFLFYLGLSDAWYRGNDLTSFEGLCIAVVGIIWTIALLIRLIPLRDHSRLS